jgi:chemotaxis protein CheC
MDLSATQQDALAELINIGFGRAAAALSKLTGHRVQLEVPHVTMCPIHEMADRLRPLVANEIATVHQIFSGPVAGDALLVLDQHSAAILKELLTSEPALPLEIDRSAREVITEIGNILLNACLGTFGNLLKLRVSFSVPHLTLDTLEHVVGSIAVERQGLRYALIVHSSFRLRNSSLTGYLVIALGVASIELLLRSLENWQGGTEVRRP